ncbi:MAG: hypothetical protein RIC87_10390 [Kiloniellales bacterium]
MKTVIPEMKNNERDFDRLFIEELAYGERFFESFCAKIGFEFRPIRKIKHSEEENFGANAWGETDIFVELEDGALLLIENKVSPVFQPDQAERYRARAEHHAKNGTEVRTVLIAPEVYLGPVPKGSWDTMCSYAEIANCIASGDARSEWKKTILLNAGNRAARAHDLAKNSAAREQVSTELLAFKSAWHQFIMETPDWSANTQIGKTDEFLYRPRRNPHNFTIWHHPFEGYLSVQEFEESLILDEVKLGITFPEGFVLKWHPKSVYLDASTPVIDMSAAFADELENVEEGMRIARHALDLAEAIIRAQPRKE